MQNLVQMNNDKSDTWKDHPEQRVPGGASRRTDQESEANKVADCLAEVGTLCIKYRVLFALEQPAGRLVDVGVQSNKEAAETDDGEKS